MILLTEQGIKKGTIDIAYRRGLDMYLRNKVKRIDVKEYVKDSDEGFIINAFVESSSGFEDYKVGLNVNSKNLLTGYKCNCPAYLENWNDGMCKHVIAVMLKFVRENDFVLKRNGIIASEKSNEIIELLKGRIFNISPINEEIKLEIKLYLDLNSSKKCSLELKIGKDKLYIVKNLKEFLNSVKNGNKDIEIGKSFVFKPSCNSFSSTDELLINLLLEIYETAERLHDPYSYNYSNNTSLFFSGKKVYPTDLQLKRLFNIINDKPFSLTLNQKTYEHTQIINTDIPLDFSIKMKNDQILLEQLNSMPTPITKDGEYFFFEGNIYKPSKEQVEIYYPFYIALLKNRQSPIIFDKKLSGQVASYIIPSLKSVSKTFNIDNTIQNNFYEEPLRIQFYFDKKEDMVVVSVKFNYGNIIINPLNDNVQEDENGILIRDILSETQAINTLINQGFEKNTDFFSLTDEEKLVTMLSEGITLLQEIGDVYYSESFKNIKIITPSNFKLNVRLNDSDLLEFTFNIDDVDKNELKNILNSVKEKKKYHRLKNGSFIPLNSKEIIEVGSLINYLDIKDSDLSKDKIFLSKYNALYIEESLRQNNLTFIERNKKFRELVNSIKDLHDSDYEIPLHLDPVLRGYQKVGFKWFKTLSACGFGGILADEMGLGKTLQAICFIESELLCNGENKKPSLVVAPSSLIYNWKSEIEKFSPSLKTLVICGGKSEREAQMQSIEDFDVAITSYPLIRRDIELYENLNFSYCFLDEAQQIKNPASQNAQCVKRIKAKGYFALTGTPIENSLTELWSIFDFIMPGYLLSHGKFVKKYENPIIKNKDENALIELNKHIKPFILRRYKRDVVKELPPKIEHRILVDMTDDQKKLYAAYLASTKESIKSEISNNGFNKSKLLILSLLTRLRQICCDPSTFIDNYEGESGKLLALDDLLEESINSNHRILLFSQFTTVLKNIEKRLKQNNIEYLYLDGNTPIKDRLIMVNTFNEGLGNVFLISLKAGGTGLNLTGADVVIHFDPWWNPAVEEQAVDRAHRIGQKKTVEVIKLISRGTIEEKIYELQEKKKEIISKVLSDDNSSNIELSSMSEEEIMDLLKG